MTNKDSLKKAISLAGGQRRLAAALGIKQPSISEWLRRGQIPVERVARVTQVTGMTREELRPDIFGLAEPTERKRGKAA